jgi:hypothetical protein
MTKVQELEALRRQYVASLNAEGGLCGPGRAGVLAALVSARQSGIGRKELAEALGVRDRQVGEWLRAAREVRVRSQKTPARAMLARVRVDTKPPVSPVLLETWVAQGPGIRVEALELVVLVRLLSGLS